MLPRLLYHQIHIVSKDSPLAPAILSPGKKSLSYRDLFQHLYSTALHLTRLGIKQGDRLALVLPNGPEMATAFLAISSVCTCAPLNPAYLVDEFKFGMEDLHVKALVTFPGEGHPARQAALSLEIPIIDLKPDPESAGIFRFASNLLVDETISEPTLAGMDDVALVLHTSGTTSRPKIVPLTHRNIFHSADNIAGTYALASTDRCLNMMPLFHIHGLIGAVAASLFAGASVVCAPGFIPGSVLAWLSDLGPTWYTAVPTIHQVILEKVRRLPESGKRVHLRFIRSCSSPLAPQVAQDLESVFNAPVVEAYGMTEAAHQIASNPLPPQPHKFGSVGLATGTTRVSILGGQGSVLPPNTPGEILIRGENVMSGYENNPGANETGFIDGWLRTGDLGSLDEDNYLFIQGRIKEIINRGGEKIAPREIDEVLLLHPAVKQAVVFGMPHPSLGEDVAAAVVLREGQTVSMQELRRFASTRLAAFKVPGLIVIVQEIPKGATGKIQRIGLAEKLKAELEMVRTLETSAGSEPRTQVEAQILSIWQQVLQKQSIGIQDDFLALGGDSIMAASILMLVNESFKVDLIFSDLFYAPTISSLADLVQEKQKKQHDHDR
jgi:acyl-CoA synthetase (AMP-forming)/AMP-acid ligase II/acyl carrier protein